MKSVAATFYEGRYKLVLEQFWDTPVRPHISESIHYFIGALSFTGRIDEAEVLLRKSAEVLSLEQLIEARFYLAVNLCRVHQFEKARSILLQNLQSRKMHINAKAMFFLFQGLAFHRYIGCRPGRALRWGRLAAVSAGKARFCYGRLLAEDLVSHCLVQSGNIHQGLIHFERVAQLAEKSGSPKLSQTFRLSATVYRSQFLLMPAEAIEALETSLENLHPDNSYALITLKLELANQKIWMGRLDEAQEDLNAASEFIYETSHLRNRILLNLRYAFISALRGHKQFALSQLAAIRLQLNEQMDLTFCEALTSTELFLLKTLPQVSADRVDRLNEKLRSLRRELLGCPGHRFFPRRLLDPVSDLESSVKTEDTHGNLVDASIRRGPSAAIELLSSGITIWVPYLFQTDARAKGLLFDLIPGSLLIFDQGEVLYTAKGMSPVLKMILQTLAKAHPMHQSHNPNAPDHSQKSQKTQPRRSKQRAQTDSHVTHENLFKRVWGYDYDPLRHSGLLYQAFSRIRQILGTRAHWVEHDEYGYQLANHLNFLSFATNEANSAALPSVDLEELNRLDLNWRQIEILKLICDTKYIDVAWCMRKFKISDMTARRDLVGLLKQGRLRRSGRARATKYGGIIDAIPVQL